MWRHCAFSGLLCIQACTTKGCAPPSSGHLPHLGTGRPICPSRHQPNPCHPGKFIRQEPPIKVHNHHALYVTPIMHSRLVYLIMSTSSVVFLLYSTMIPQIFSIYLGNWTLQEEFDDIARQFENHPHIRLVLRVEENLTHNIFGAADIFVIPSMFEPCGLTQVLVIIPQPPAPPCKLVWSLHQLLQDFHIR